MDDHMTGPGAHEDAATSQLRDGKYEAAQVYALLALAAAVNRLADAHQAQT